MDFAKLVSHRYSVRSYSTKPVEKEKIEAILDTARKAPSAVNFQPYTIYIISQPENLEKIRKCYHRSWLGSAPVIMVVVGKKDMAWKRASDMKNFTDIDTAILIDHITLQAADIGLGTCWICNFDIDLLNETLALKPQQEPIAIIPVGYPETDDVPAKKRKGIDELVVWM